MNPHKRGHWLPENKRKKSMMFICSVCGETAYYPQPTRTRDAEKRCGYKFCPHCGIMMEDDNEDR